MIIEGGCIDVRARNIDENYIHPYIYPLKKTKYLMSKHDKVYFITDRRYVKIGKTKNIISRLSGLQTGHPEKLYVLGYVDGGIGEEKEIHKRFNKYRVRGEGFRLTEEFAQEIKDLCKGEYKKRIKTSMKGNTNGNGRNQYSKKST